MDLRPYQNDCIAAIDRSFANGFTAPLVSVPTGGGKTIIFAKKAFQHQYTGRVLVMAHRGELIRQAYEKIRDATGIHAGIEMAQRRATPMDQVVVASVQTLAQGREPEGEQFDLAIIDEAHHAVADNQYSDVIDMLKARLRLGVTATAYRGDKKSLNGLFDDMPYTIGMIDLIQQGYLANVRVKTLPVEIDLSKVRKHMGDFQAKGLGDALEPMLDNLARIVARDYSDKKILTFCPLIDTSKSWTAALCRYGIRAAHVDGNSPDRDEILKDFTNDRHRALSNASLLCLDLETEILTDRGWVGHDQISMEHKVANWDFDGTTFFEKPHEIVKRPLTVNEHMVSVDGRVSNLRVTNTHRMIVGAGENSKYWKKISAQELRAGHVLPVCGVAEPFQVSIEAEEGVAMFSKRRVSANAYNMRKLNGTDWNESFVEAERRERQRNSLSYRQPKDLSVDECRLIGFWIADGSKGRPGGGVEYTLCQGCCCPNIVDWVDGLLHRLEVSFVRHNNSDYENPHIRWSLCRGTGGGSQKRSGIYHLEPYLCKDGSDLFWGLNEEQFDALVEGYWMGDGDHGQVLNGFPASIKFNDTNKTWIDLLSAIGCVRGWRCAVYHLPMENPKHRDQWRLRMIKKADIHFSGRTPIIHEPYSPEMVWCVRTTSKNIITRRRGKVVVMGNTEGYDEPSIDCIIILRPTQSRVMMCQMVGRGTRLFPGKDHVLVLDPMFTCEKHNILSPADLAGETDEDAAGVKKYMSDGKDLTEALDELREERRHALAEQMEAASRRTPYEKELAELSLILDDDLGGWEPTAHWHEHSATEGQIGALVKMGVNPELILNKGHASHMLEKLINRSKSKLATIKQVRYARRLGHQDPTLATFDELSAFISSRARGGGTQGQGRRI